MNEKISIIIPVYNVEKFIKECIESVLNQNYSNLEIILVDDGSKDNSGKICDEYALDNKNIKVIHKKNGGLSSARNAGLDYASGKYIMFIDSDDFVDYDICNFLYYIIKQKNADIAVCSMYDSKNNLNQKKNNNKIYTFTKTETLKEIFKEKKFNTSACAKLYKKSLFKNIKFPNGKIYEDLFTIYKVILNSKKVVFSNQKKYHYRINLDGITSNKFQKNYFDFFEAVDNITKELNLNNLKLNFYIKNMACRYSISILYQNLSCHLLKDSEIEYLLNVIKKNILKYLFSEYKIKSKLFGLLSIFGYKIMFKIYGGGLKK